MKTNNIHRFHIILGRNCNKLPEQYVLVENKRGIFPVSSPASNSFVLVTLECTVNLRICLVYKKLSDCALCTVHFPYLEEPRFVPATLFSCSKLYVKILFFLRTLRYVQPVF